MGNATSSYRQVRVTATEEADGWLSVRVTAKPSTEAWTYRQTVWHARMRMTSHPPTWLGSVERLAEVLLGIQAADD